MCPIYGTKGIKNLVKALMFTSGKPSNNVFKDCNEKCEFKGKTWKVLHEEFKKRFEMDPSLYLEKIVKEYCNYSDELQEMISKFKN